MHNLFLFIVLKTIVIANELEKVTEILNTTYYRLYVPS